MPPIILKCPNCRALWDAPKRKCPYCRAAFVYEDGDEDIESTTDDRSWEQEFLDNLTRAFSGLARGVDES